MSAADYNRTREHAFDCDQSRLTWALTELRQRLLRAQVSCAECLILAETRRVDPQLRALAAQGAALTGQIESVLLALAPLQAKAAALSPGDRS